MPRRKEVDAWFARYDNPMKDVVQRIREIILAADSRIDECIKWQAPTFTFEGNLASFFPKSKQHASLMFHQGAMIPGTHPRLEGSGDTSRVLKLGSVAEANAAKKDLVKLVKAWCEWKAGSAKTPARGNGAKKTRSKKKTASKKPPRGKAAAARAAKVARVGKVAKVAKEAPAARTAKAAKKVDAKRLSPTKQRAGAKTKAPVHDSVTR